MNLIHDQVGTFITVFIFFFFDLFIYGIRRLIRREVAGKSFFLFFSFCMHEHEKKM